MTNLPFQVQRFAELAHWYEALRAEHEVPPRLYALVDGALSEDMLRLVEARGADWGCLYPEAMLEAASPAVGPYLIELMPEDTSHAALMRALLRHSEHVDLVLWIASTVPLARLCAYLHQYAEVELPDRREALLRYYDPMILETLLTAFTAEQRDQFLAPFHELRYWRDEWKTVYGGAYVELPSTIPKRIVLTTDQQERLAMATLAESLYFEIRGDLLPPMSDVSSRVCIDHVRGLLDRAMGQHLIKKQNELTLFTLVGLNVNQAFDAHPSIATQLDPKQRLNTPLQQVFSSVPSNVWDELLQSVPQDIAR